MDAVQVCTTPETLALPPMMNSGAAEANGLLEWCVIGPKQFGIFRDIMAQWSVRRRPIDSNGIPTDSWGFATNFRTKREALAFIAKHNRKWITGSE